MEEMSMLEQITNDVYVEAKEVSLAVSTATEPQRHVQALQYALQNRGMQSTSVRIDFSASQHVRLVCPEGEDDEEDPKGSLVFDVAMGPLQRQAIVHVLREKQAHALVRVEYAVVERLDDVSLGRKVESNDNELNRAIDQSRVTYRALYNSQQEVFSHRDRFKVPLREDTIRRVCRDINCFTRDTHVRFVDHAFSPSSAALWGSREPPESMSETLGAHHTTWRHLGHVIDSSWSFMDCQTNRAELMWVYEGHRGQESWVCAVDSLSAQAPLWCKRWFGERQSKRLSRSHELTDSLGVVTVNLCQGGRQWVPVVVDLFVPVVASSDKKSGLLCAWPSCGEFYAVLLQKAYAKMSGSYAAMGLKSTREVLEDLTGVPTIELFPHGSWRYSGMHDNARRLAQQRKSTKTKTMKKGLILVSFQAFDNHHCAFPLLGVASSTSGFVVRDPTRMLLNTALAKLGPEGGLSEEDGQCVLTEKAFLHLGPIVFEVLMSHTNSWRRRKIIHCRGNGAITSRLAVSCASLQTLVLKGFATQFDGLNEAAAEMTAIAVDRVEDDDSWRRLGEEEVQESVGQRSWIASAGEFVVTTSATIREVPDDRTSSATRKLTAHDDVYDNFRLLFQLLDRDMDGIVSSSELLDLFRVYEQTDEVEVDKISEFVDNFIDNHASHTNDSGRGLSLSDLIDVYQSLRHREDPALPDEAQNNPETVASILWRDLLLLLGLKNVAEIDVGDLWVLTCVISSDRDDVVLVTLD